MQYFHRLASSELKVNLKLHSKHQGKTFKFLQSISAQFSQVALSKQGIF